MTEKKIIDFVALVQNNPLNCLSSENNYNSKIIQKIKSIFTDYEKQLFVANFYCYLNFSKTDFVVDLDLIWKWTGFNKKSDCNSLLVNNFQENIDYKIENIKNKLSVEQDDKNQNPQNPQKTQENIKNLSSVEQVAKRFTNWVCESNQIF